MNCAQCESRMSDYLESAVGDADRRLIDAHLHTCSACTELLAGMGEVLAWANSFPVFDAPVWLPMRIVANTPRVARESWLDTLTFMGRWIIEPRTAAALFTAGLVLGWLGNLAGISPDWTAVVRDPAAIYYGAESAVNRAYDEAIRTYYHSPLVTQIQSRIEQFREIS
jgi:predicted anti-sigma-YlaC factor YlaD